MRSASLSVLVAILVAACGTVLTVRSGFVSDVDVAQWANYSWTEPDDPGTDPLVRSLNELIRQEIDERLSAKGYARVPKDQADFLVRHAISAQWEIAEISERELEAIREQELVSGEEAADPYFASHEHGEGLLHVFLTRLDGDSFWEGQVEAPVDYRGQSEEKIPRAISKLFADFPARERDR